MVRDGVAAGALTRDKILIDSTSGNTGVAYSMVGAALGYRVALVMPANVSAARKQIAAAYGTEIIFSSELEGSDGAIRLVRELVAAESRTSTSIPISIRTSPTRARTTSAPGARSGSRPADGSRTSSPASARPGPSWAPDGA